MNNTTRQTSKNRTNPWVFETSQDNALIAAAVISTALVVSALFIPHSSTNAQSTNELNLESAHALCMQANTAAECDTLVQAITKQKPNQLPGDPVRPYKTFSSCRDAVDYLFSDRTDHQRAIGVVYRESTNNPNARRPGSQYAGCAQLSSTLQATFLRGPWNDAYYNVLAMRDAVDDPRWGWCHWDLVNYCEYGGEF
ncbi:hypothetical protein IT415_03050 [bacterium]|nr:hypothetical protein [bacterium]